MPTPKSRRFLGLGCYQTSLSVLLRAALVWLSCSPSASWFGVSSTSWARNSLSWRSCCSIFSWSACCFEGTWRKVKKVGLALKEWWSCLSHRSPDYSELLPICLACPSLDDALPELVLHPFQSPVGPAVSQKQVPTANPRPATERGMAAC